MKTRFLLFALLCACFVSAQRLNTLTFPGSLGSLTVQFSGVGADKATATQGNCWALADSSVDMSNVTPIATFESNSTEYGALVDPATMPSNFTTPQMLYSQMFLKSDNTGLSKWRKTKVTINQLIPADLPISVANTGVTQRGYSYVAEPTGTTVYTVQLHTNENAAYFAFRQPAYQLKFQLEHTGTSSTSNAQIFVEGSADLDTWVVTDTLALFNDGRKIDYTIDVSDLSFRYLRLRIANLESSRGIRRINLRYASVTPYPTEGNPYTFETMPSEWSAYLGGTIEQSDLHYKHLNKSLKWSWVAGSSLRVTKPVGIDKAPGMCYWIYNETPSTTPIKFNMYKNGVLLKSFNYDINFKGWRAFWYLFKDDGGMSGTTQPDMVEMKSTSATNAGTLFIDNVSFSSIVTWERMNDFHISVLKQSSQITNMVGMYNTPRTATTLLPTAAEQTGIDLIAKRWETFLMGSGKYAQNAQMTQKMSAANSYIKSCKANLTKYELVRQPNGTVSGKGLAGFDDLHQDGIMGLALDARMNNTQTSKQLALDAFDYYNDQGWAAGSAMGTFRFAPLRYEGYCHSLFLMRNDLLAEQGNESYQEKLRTLYWISSAGKLFETTLTPGENTDNIRASSVGILAYVLMENDPAKKLQAVKAFKRYMDNALALTDGGGDMLKLDGSVFHHGFTYNSEYGTQGLFQAALYYYLFRDTPFALSEQSYNNLKLALSKWNLHSSNLSYPISTGGRFPSGGMSNMVAAYAFMALAKPADTEMTAIAKRMCPLDNSAIITNFVTNYNTRITHMNSIGALEAMLDVAALPTPKATEPQGSDYLPFTGMLLSRYKGWLVAIKGFSQYVTDYEFISPSNYYGRYLSNDHIQIWNEKRNLNSYSSTSWDWSRFPGTTAKYLPADVLRFNSTRGDKERNRSDDYFLGGTVLNDSVSLFANRLHDNANDKSFRAYKSNFLFANTMVSLGTNINCTDVTYDVETTLFQDKQNGIVPQINGTSWSSSGTTALTGTTNTVLKNSWGNTYIVYPYGGGSLEIRRQTQTNKSESDATSAPANFDVAYINHGKAPVNKGYRYITVLDGDAAKTTLLAGDNSPIQIVQQDNNAHVVYNSQLKTTAYAVYAANATFATGMVASTVRPFVALLKQNSDGTVDIAVSDPDMNQVSGVSSAVLLKITLRGNFELVQGNSTLIFSKQTGSVIISQACKAGATYKIKLRNLDYTSVDKTTFSNVSFYPNPVTNQLIVTSSQTIEPLTLNVLDVNGRQLMTGLMTSSSYTFNTNQISRGIYFLKIQNKNGAEIHKIIKK